ncbi:MAG TPA: HD domain-containing protein [Pirellulaceae bacterium]|nr:HD domain-containing protein [Pirellulaceae bacterium]HMO91914.1 HD domain-containing protein [Pirellulaceae bacterium]HMP68714.1 HD domain-containing protein [Pirellulaceae bacterium]
MPRTFINQLTEGTKIDEVYLVSQKQLRPNRQGNLYLQVRLSDKTGSVTGMLWNAAQTDYDRVANGNYVRVNGNAQVFNGAIQVILKTLTVVDAGEVNEADFVSMNIQQINELVTRLTSHLRLLKNPHLVNLAEAYLIDENFMAKLKSAPAGIKNHHAYIGGLLQHVVDLMDVAKFIGDKYVNLDGDLLIMAAFLHDSGKVDELTYSPDFGYSDHGQLLGHMTLGVEMLTEKVKEAGMIGGESLPEDLVVKLKHIIMSHHGDPSMGSPVLPMTLEAIAFHYIDNLDAKIQAVSQLIEEDVNNDSNWTTYNPALSRKILKK